MTLDMHSRSKYTIKNAKEIARDTRAVQQAKDDSNSRKWQTNMYTHIHIRIYAYTSTCTYTYTYITHTHMDTRTGDQKAKKPQGRYCPQTLENRIQSGFKRGDVYCLWKRYRDRAVRVCVYVSTTANRNLCIGWMHASLCVCVRVYQVRMFTPDKIKYADQLYGIAEVQQDLDLRQQSLFEDYVSSGYVSEDLVAGVCVCVCVWRSECGRACVRDVFFSLASPTPPCLFGF